MGFSYFLLPTSYFLLPTSYFLLPTSYFLLPTSYFLLPTSYFLKDRAMRKQVIGLGMVVAAALGGVAWTSGEPSSRSLTLHEMAVLRAGLEGYQCQDVCVGCTPGGSCPTALTEAACLAMWITTCDTGMVQKDCIQENGYSCSLPPLEPPHNCETLTKCQWITMPMMPQGYCAPRLGTSIGTPAYTHSLWHLARVLNPPLPLGEGLWMKGECQDGCRSNLGCIEVSDRAVHRNRVMKGDPWCGDYY